jgi:pimeloyl-ACP methyl ester carboxylesterase
MHLVSYLKQKLIIILSVGVTVFPFVSCREKSADRLADIDGKKMHVLERGQGQPAVVFLTGIICPLEHFYTVQTQVSKITKTFSYDRSGLGLSEILDTVRTYDRVATELDLLLAHEAIPPPYVLVAHSYGGGIAREYYKQFPKKVAGFVFVDCANDDVFFDSLWLKNLARKEDFAPDSLATKGEGYELSYLMQNLSLSKGEFKTDLPVQLLVAAGPRAGSAELISTKVNTYKEFNRGAPQMKIIYTKHSGHHIQREQPELVLQSVSAVIEEVRAKNRKN